jgi:hypothetical protein
MTKKKEAYDKGYKTNYSVTKLFYDSLCFALTLSKRLNTFFSNYDGKYRFNEIKYIKFFEKIKDNKPSVYCSSSYDMGLMKENIDYTLFKTNIIVMNPKNIRCFIGLYRYAHLLKDNTLELEIEN